MVGFFSRKRNLSNISSEIFSSNSKQKRFSYKRNNSKTLINIVPFGLSQRIFFICVSLTFLGVLFIADVSAPGAITVFGDKFYYAKQQLVWGLIGIGVMIVVANVKVSFWEKYSTYIFLASLILLVLVLIPGFSVKVLGARRWLKIGPIGLQPSEFMKLGLIIFNAKLAKSSKNIYSYVVALGIVSFLIMLQPDLGTTLVIAATVLSQIFIAGISLSTLFPVTLVSLLTAIFFVFSSNYRRQRFSAFLDPFSDSQAGSYHVQQILYALASGGVFGLGLGQSKQKYLFLPEASTDSIFAIIGEEVGFFGSLAIVFLFLILIINMFQVVKQCKDDYSRVLSIGIISWLSIQTLVNLGSIVSAIPFTGVPLPFISYGGSSLLTVLIAHGIIISIAKENAK